MKLTKKAIEDKTNTGVLEGRNKSFDVLWNKRKFAKSWKNNEVYEVLKSGNKLLLGHATNKRQFVAIVYLTLSSSTEN